MCVCACACCTFSPKITSIISSSTYYNYKNIRDEVIMDIKIIFWKFQYSGENLSREGGATVVGALKS